ILRNAKGQGFQRWPMGKSLGGLAQLVQQLAANLLDSTMKAPGKIQVCRLQRAHIACCAITVGKEPSFTIEPRWIEIAMQSLQANPKCKGSIGRQFWRVRLIPVQL